MSGNGFLTSFKTAKKSIDILPKSHGLETAAESAYSESSEAESNAGRMKNITFSWPGPQAD
jgi:hypothetical protein